MLQHLNTLIGFAAVFAILSLLVTSITQVIRGMGRLKTRTLVERLLRLFGELDDPERFVAAILTHPSLEGERGKEHYALLTNPCLDPRRPDRRGFSDDAAWQQACSRASEVRRDIGEHVAVVLGRTPGLLVMRWGMRSRGRWWRRPWPRTEDLDKQTVKDIGQSVYEAIGHLVDKPLLEPVDGGAPPQRWAWELKRALDDADTVRLASLSKAPGSRAADRASPVPPPPPAVAPFRGRMWMLAASAFPEAEGKAPPLKTYVAAFHDEAQASSSDAFTWRIRWVTVAVSVVLAATLRLDAIAVWDRAAHANSADTATAAQRALELKDTVTKGGSAAELKPLIDDIIEKTSEAAASSLLPEPSERWPNPLGFLLAVAALSLGAPFWFEVLKSAIQMKSAFTREK